MSSKTILLATALALAVPSGAALAQSSDTAFSCNGLIPAPMRVSAPQAFMGVVIGFLSTEEAWQYMQANERRFGRTLNPAYLRNQRVVLLIGGSIKSVALVPHGMSARIGESVRFLPYHIDPNNFCEYIPPLLVP